MIATFLLLLSAHVVADFVLQGRDMVARKRQPAMFGAHVLIVALSAAIALAAYGSSAWIAVGLVTLAHAVIDGIKTWWPPRRADRDHFAVLKVFVIDQTAHLFSLAIIALLLPEAFSSGGWPRLLLPMARDWLFTAVITGTGFVLATRVGALLIETIMQGLAGSLAKIDTSAKDNTKTVDAGHLPRAGVWIGWLERILVFVFVLLGQFEAIGFVIAAKSVLRFDYARKVEQSELVIVGTLASFSWAIGCALATRAALGWLR